MAIITKADVDKTLGFVYNIHTQANYRSHLSHFIGVDASAEAIQAVVSEWHGLSQSTIRARRAALKLLLEELSVPDILAQIKFPKGRPPKKRRALTTKEVDAVIKAAQTVEEKLLVAIMLDTGLRAGSIPRITYGDLEERSFDLMVKGGKTITVLVTPGMTILGRKLQESLGASDDQYIFTKDGQEPITYYHIYTVFNKLARRAGISEDVVPHSTRHTFATRLSDDGTSIPVIQALMGHTSIATTMEYVHPSADAMAEAISRNALSRRLTDEYDI